MMTLLVGVYCTVDETLQRLSAFIIKLPNELKY